MEFAGEFETHLTVRLESPGDVEQLRAWAGERKLKCTHIVLARGSSASQPMLTFPERGTLSEAKGHAAASAAAAEAGGFHVTRVKIEAAPTNADVPIADDAGREQPADRYFEHHVKLLLESGTAIEPIVEIAHPHRAHVSRNALRRREDAREERFVTQRCFRVGRDTADAALGRLLDALTRAGHEIIDVEREFVVYDSNVARDAGWIDA